MSYIYLNGSIVSSAQAKVSVFDQGFLYGYGLFETMRCYKGKVFRLRHHISRLQDGAKWLRISMGAQFSELEQAVNDTLEANDLADARIRVTLTAGQGTAGSTLPSQGEPNIVIVVSPLQLPNSAKYRNGYRLGLATSTRMSSAQLPRLKSLNYMENLLARREVLQTGADEALILNEHGYVTECSRANVFFVIDDKLVTPADDCGLLPGITRSVVMELAQDLNLACDQVWVSMSDALRASEVFITSSLIELMSVVAIGNHVVGGGKPGGITDRLSEAYRALVKKELRL